MLGFEDSVVNKINAIPTVKELGNRQLTSDGRTLIHRNPSQVR